MMTVPVEIRESNLHGHGVFALKDIRRGAVVWMFHPGLDRRVNADAIKYCEPVAREFIMQRGYVNPRSPDTVIVCIDEAQYLNFPRPNQPANLQMGDMQDGEHILLAAHDIPAGDELTVPPESDSDYERKMETYGHS